MIIATTTMPNTSPTLVMMSMGDSNAYAKRPAILDGDAAHPELRNRNPTDAPLKTRKG
jgi:hypothetical protein